jgi:hypothetical protein
VTTVHKRGSTLAIVVGYVLIVALISVSGCSDPEDYFKKRISHSKLTTVIYHGEWSLGEYRECYSVNSRDAELVCTDFTRTDVRKIFNIDFIGDSAYDESKSSELTHRWLCRRNDGDPSFSCGAKEIPQTSGPNAADTPKPERQLTNDEVEYFRKRNECEYRFYDKKIYEVDGMSIGPACKQNPDRMP